MSLLEARYFHAVGLVVGVHSRGRFYERGQLRIGDQAAEYFIVLRSNEKLEI
jgi:hypothetical protein